MKGKTDERNQYDFQLVWGGLWPENDVMWVRDGVSPRLKEDVFDLLGKRGKRVGSRYGKLAFSD